MDYRFYNITEAVLYSELEAMYFPVSGSFKTNYEKDGKYLRFLFYTSRAVHGTDISEMVTVDIRTGIPFWIVLHNGAGREYNRPWYLDKIKLTYSDVKKYAKAESETIYDRYKDINETNWSGYVDTTLPKPIFSDPKLNKLFERVDCSPLHSLTSEEVLRIINHEELDKQFTIRFYNTEHTDAQESILIVRADSRTHNNSYCQITEVRRSVYVLEYPVEFGHGKYYPHRDIFNTVEEAYDRFIDRLRTDR